MSKAGTKAANGTQMGRFLFQATIKIIEINIPTSLRVRLARAPRKMLRLNFFRHIAMANVPIIRIRDRRATFGDGSLGSLRAINSFSSLVNMHSFSVMLCMLFSQKVLSRVHIKQKYSGDEECKYFLGKSSHILDHIDGLEAQHYNRK
ncbi:hypothetical protein BpHYR1_049657 [Brachionus plicatilis]|uniref:Uncharacterized protein n=1 Tax=Brachionus plicatilis TaxID=10195 RepID=A0A3M7R5B6_BRAPC|nr:hypothetical protein BpHYR1_049657 [Brachionus plicatilis]